MAFLQRYAPWMLGILRIVTALVFMEHGTQKFFHFPPQARFPGSPGGGRAAQAAQSAVDTASSALHSAADTATSALQQAATAASSALDTIVSAASSAPAPAPGGPPGGLSGLFLIAAILETFGGLALVLGFLTRPVAFILAGETAYIFWFMNVARSGSIFPASNGGEDAVLYCFIFLYLVFAGAGAFAVDNAIWRRKAA